MKLASHKVQKADFWTLCNSHREWYLLGPICSVAAMCVRLFWRTAGYSTSVWLLSAEATKGSKTDIACWRKIRLRRLTR